MSFPQTQRMSLQLSPQIAVVAETDTLQVHLGETRVLFLSMSMQIALAMGHFRLGYMRILG